MKGNSVLEFRALLGGLLLLSMPTASVALVQYAVTDLGTLPNYTPYSAAFDINNSGEVVGSVVPGWNGSNSISHAFLYRNSTMTDLGTLGGGDSGASAINDSGQVVGYAHAADGLAHAFLYGGSTMTDLGTLSGGNHSYAYDINNSAQVVGASWIDTGGTYHAFRYSGSTMSDLGTLGGIASVANGINNGGQVVGWSYTASGTRRAFRYSGTTMSDLGTLGGDGSEARDINDNGQIVGDSYPASGSYHAFLYSGSTMTDLGTLGGMASSAASINRSGQIVGYSNTSSGTNHAFVYSGSTMTDLNTLIKSGEGWTLEGATGINDKGQIVGTGTNPAGQSRAFLLSPVNPANTCEPQKPDQASKSWLDNLPNLPRPNGSTAKNLVVLVHGWQDSPSLFTTAACGDLGSTNMKANIEAALGDKLGTEWDVIAYDWSAYAMGSTGGLLPRPSGECIKNARAHGQNLATQIRASGYTGNIHFIAHSLGGEVIDVATNRLVTAKNFFGRSQGSIHETFLDTYTPYDWAAFQGENATWAEHYFDKQFIEGFFGSPTASTLTQDTVRNVDITALRDQNGSYGENHKWPVRWYDATIGTNIPENDGWGFELSQEAGLLEWPPSKGELGKTVVLQKIGTETYQFPQPTPRSLPTVRPSEKLINYSDTGTVATTTDSLSFGTGSPVWANFLLDTNIVTNFVEFDYEFSSIADGALSVFLDGELLGSFFERFARDGKYPSGMLFFDSPMDPGFHVLGFRVDPLTDDQSLVTVSEIHAGIVVPEPSTLALLGVGAIGLLAWAWRRRRRAYPFILPKKQTGLLPNTRQAVSPR
jgi:probable HAF family extracellular repeat protein